MDRSGRQSKLILTIVAAALCSHSTDATKTRGSCSGSGAKQFRPPVVAYFKDQDDDDPSEKNTNGHDDSDFASFVQLLLIESDDCISVFFARSSLPLIHGLREWENNIDNYMIKDFS